MQRYIGIDVHSKRCTVAVVDGTGKHAGQHVVETNGAALVECLKMIPGERRVRVWRRAAARRLVFGEPGVLALAPNECDSFEASG